MQENDLWLSEIKQRFREDKQGIERAIAQLNDDEFCKRIAPGFNSVATIIRHVAGNLRSRWTDFLTTDGEKPDRDRETEFADWTGSRSELMQRWEQGFRILFASLDSLQPSDLLKTVTIRKEPHTVPKAIIRALDHLAYHTGQVLFLSRLAHTGEWRYVTVPPQRSRS